MTFVWLCQLVIAAGRPTEEFQQPCMCRRTEGKLKHAVVATLPFNEVLMTVLIFCLLLFIGQVNTSKEVVRLGPGKASISQDYGGKLVELINAPAEVSLPSLRRSSTSWSVDVKNLGPHDVTIRNGDQLTVLLHPSESATFASRGSAYVRLH